jgi:hypothetical protein
VLGADLAGQLILDELLKAVARISASEVVRLESVSVRREASSDRADSCWAIVANLFV